MTYFIKFYFYKTYLVFFLIILRFRTIGKCFYDTPSCNAVENNGQMIAGLRQSHSPNAFLPLSCFTPIILSAKRPLPPPTIAQLSVAIRLYSAFSVISHANTARLFMLPENFQGISPWEKQLSPPRQQLLVILIVLLIFTFCLIKGESKLFPPVFYIISLCPSGFRSMFFPIFPAQTGQNCSYCTNQGHKTIYPMHGCNKDLFFPLDKTHPGIAQVTAHDVVQ